MTSVTDLDTVLRVLRVHLPELRERFDVASLAVFGSLARSEADGDSDVDLLVTFGQAPGLLGFLALQEHLTQLLDRRVDLVMRSALKPMLRERVLEEAIAA